MKFKLSNQIFLAFLLLSFPIISSALECEASGIITHATIDNNAGQNSSRVYLRPNSLSENTYAYSYTTNDTNAIFGSLVATAYATKARVKIRGDNGGQQTCPAPGDFVDMGQIVQFRFE